MATVMQPFSHSIAICSQEFNNRIEVRTYGAPFIAEHKRRNQSHTKTNGLQPLHTRGTFHWRLQPLYTEKTQGFVPRLSPKTKPMQRPCRHSNACCSTMWNPQLPTHMATQHGNMHAAVPLQSIVMCCKVPHHASFQPNDLMSSDVIHITPPFIAVM